jgi:nucleoside-diphosphate-sugar epimerase
VPIKRVLLTGASGFVGQHCLEPLAARGYEVHAVSSRPRPASVSGVTWHEADLHAPAAAADLVNDIAPTHLLHLAWYVVPGKLISAPENFAWVPSSLELMRQFGEHGGQRLVGCGSAYEYDWSYGYCSERLTPAVPNTVYGSCKQALNLMMQSYAEHTGLSAAWGRAFFLYGPN